MDPDLTQAYKKYRLDLTKDSGSKITFVYLSPIDFFVGS